ncbi:MAG: hypothetical protein P8K79_01365 [Mariniblastus sp.]|nr:hypothetical protein [Mariniblastus sp.]
MRVLTRLMLVGLFTCSMMVLGGCEKADAKKTPATTPTTKSDEDHDHDEGDGDHDHDEDGAADKK